MSAPAFQAVMTSVGVSAPGITATPARLQNATVARSSPGLMMKRAPAARQASAAASSSTVPAPTSTRSPSEAQSSRMTSTPPGTVRGTSRLVMPAATRVWHMARASSAVGTRITGSRAPSRSRFRTSDLAMLVTMLFDVVATLWRSCR
jgi:hypothetical protein